MVERMSVGGYYLKRVVTVGLRYVFGKVVHCGFGTGTGSVPVMKSTCGSMIINSLRDGSDSDILGGRVIVSDCFNKIMAEGAAMFTRRAHV